MGQTPRVEARTKVMIRARLRGAGPEREACILDLSTRGLAASAENAPQRGEIVELVVGRNNLVGQVKWSGPRRFGMAFRDRISVIGLMSGEGELKHGARGPVRSAEQVTAVAAKQGGLIRRIEFAVFFAAAFVGTLYVADFVGSALGSLSSVEAALAGKGVSQLAHAQ
ncbi:PilZ domain-containing protein [Altererythrobacter fulvus]|uniref:PilZ domain-containing protein n=1 Tax=Caenibius fulvus TaxID=2126012 RepID=UPI0030169945